MPQRYVKDPQAQLDYSVDWSEWLAAGDAIDTSAWTADEGIEILTAPAASQTATVATVWISGGTDGQKYNLTNSIVTSTGRTDERTIRIEVRTR